MNLALVGYRGVGKSHVAHLVGERLAWPVVDVDLELQRRERRSIAEIFAADGEDAFREIEATLIDELMRRDQHVFALGGGAVLRAENRTAIQARAFTVWLTANPATILQRISTDAASPTQRPRLTDAATPLEEIERLLKRREPLYRETADVIVDAENQTPERAAAEIYQLFAPLIESAS
ncbi:MAG: shikimate kinase [Blastopirellula sp. JB062]